AHGLRSCTRRAWAACSWSCASGRIRVPLQRRGAAADNAVADSRRPPRASPAAATPTAGSHAGPSQRPAMTLAQTIAELDALRTRGAEFDVLLEAAVQGVHQLDTRFHWTGIYELFSDDVLRLGPFIGAPTEHCFI